MKKIRLDLDALEVESFQTTTDETFPQDGTVYGLTAKTLHFPCQTEEMTCVTCFSCQPTCGIVPSTFALDEPPICA